MGTRDYGQYCGMAYALDVVGERWALLIVRDLLVGDKRFGDLKRGLPRVPTNVLTRRLHELEAAGLVERRLAPAPGRGVVYALTALGLALEPVALALGRWGSQLLGDPPPDQIVTVDSLVMALRSTFRPDAARHVAASYELRVGPDIVLHAVIDDGALQAGPGPFPDPDLTITTGPAIRAVMARELSATAAVRTGTVVLHGRKRLFSRFPDYFCIEASPGQPRRSHD